MERSAGFLNDRYGRMPGSIDNTIDSTGLITGLIPECPLDYDLTVPWQPSHLKEGVKCVTAEQCFLSFRLRCLCGWEPALLGVGGLGSARSWGERLAAPSDLMPARVVTRTVHQGRFIRQRAVHQLTLQRLKVGTEAPEAPEACRVPGYGRMARPDD